MNLRLSVQAMNGRLDRFLYGLAWLLALALPFEMIRPLLRLPGLEFTNLELLLAVAAVVWLTIVWQSGVTRARIRPLLWPILFFVGTVGLAAVVAPLYRLEAIKFAARLATGCVLLLLLATVVTGRKRLVGLVWAISLGAAATALLGLAEWAGWAWLAPLWPLFKVAPSRIGGELRLSASFQYATIAAAYLEMVVPLALLLAAGSARRAWRWLAMGVAVVATVAVVLTLTRSSILLLAGLYTGLLLLVWHFQGLRPLARPTAGAALTLVVTVIALFWSNALFRTRLMTENDLNWYNASYQAPPSLTLATGQSEQVTIQVFNSGQATWSNSGEQAFALGYNWLDGSGEAMAGASEVDLPHTVPPGEWVTLVATITAPPQPGNYIVSWGMLQRHILWFHHRGVPDGRTEVQVGPPAAAPAVVSAPARPAPLESPPELPTMPVTVPRRALWQAAGQMIVDRPWLGHGPGNFRRLYGRYLQLPAADERIHANNLYLELLATTGVAGLFSFAWLLRHCLRPLLHELTTSMRRRSPAQHTVAAAGFATPLIAVCLAGSLAAFLGHGLSDYFLGFTPTALLFWFVVGLAWALPAADQETP